MKRFLFIVFSIILCVASCSKNDEIVELEVKSFEIISNSDKGIFIKTELGNFNDEKISSYGVKWFYEGNNSVVFEERIHSDLSVDNFQLLISKNLKKDYKYNIFSFVESGGLVYNSDTLEIVSKYYAPISIDSVYPINGFINDTINISGKNFCDDSDLSRNYIYLSGARHNCIYTSDSLIKAIIPSFIHTSELTLGIEGCGEYNEINDVFTINPPVLDSIENKEKFVGEKIKLYGKNIHHFISELWLDDKRVELERTDYKDTIVAVVPKGLSIGKVDLKLQVLDRVIYKEDYYQTTSPYITEIEPKNIGFLDTVKVKGKYFNQGNLLPAVNIDGAKQNVISHNGEEIEIIVSKYFKSETPELEIEINELQDSKVVSVLPPKITGFDKESYDLTDNIIINTDAFISKNNIEIGGEDISYGVSFDIDSKGDVTVSLGDWLDIDSYAYQYKIEEGGRLKIELDNPYGIDSDFVQLNPPVIHSIDKEIYTHNDYITIEGENFAFDEYNNIYIDGELVDNPHNSSYNVRNNKINFELLLNTTKGKHELYVEVAGQKSNIVEYEIEAIEVKSINKVLGTRRDEYIISGVGLNGMKIYANDRSCEIIESNDSEVKFKFPYSKALGEIVKLTGVAGDQSFNIANFNGIEPHSSNEETLNDVSYYGRHVSGSDSENWYYINSYGVHKFNLNTVKWEVFDTTEVPFSTPVFGEKLHLTVTDEYLYLPYGNNLYSYELSSKTWEVNSINVSVKRGVFINDNLYVVSNSDNEFYVGNVSENNYSKVSTGFSFNYETITYGDDKIFFNSWQGEVFYYDIINRNFKGIGRPRNYFGSYQNVSLKYYNNKLYFSGGLTNVDEEHRLYEYNFDTAVWIEKTPMLHKMYNHHIFINNEIFYSGLGNGKYGNTNKEMDMYDLNKDPH